MIDWQYLRQQAAELARLLGWLAWATLACIGLWTVLGWLGLGA